MAVDLTVGMIGATVEIDQPQADGRRIVGTGFLVDDPTPDGRPRTVLITAAHVLDKMAGSSARIGYRFQGPDGAWRFSAQPLTIRQGATQLWTRSPSHDIAALAIEAPPEFAKAAIPLTWLADEESFGKVQLGPGDEMFVLGFPEGLAANSQGFPILRSGRVASYPVSPKQFQSFLLDFRVFSGNSGGPVFITPDLRRRPEAPAMTTPMVAGILTQQTSVGDERLELGIVVRAEYIRQTLQLLDHPGASPPAVTASAVAAGQPASAVQKPKR